MDDGTRWLTYQEVADTRDSALGVVVAPLREQLDVANRRAEAEAVLRGRSVTRHPIRELRFLTT
jgi:hypothetical protein